MKDFFKLLREKPNYTYLLIASLISDFGDALTNLAMPLLIYWREKSVLGVGTFYLIVYLAVFLFSQPLSNFIKTKSKKTVMIVSLLLQSMCILIFILSSNRIIVYTTVFVSTIVMLPFNLSVGYLRQKLLSKSEIKIVVPILRIITRIIKVLAPLLGGAILLFLKSYRVLFVLDIISFIVAIIVIYILFRHQEDIPTSKSAKENKPFLEGWRYIWSDKKLKWLVIASQIFILFDFIYFVIKLPFAISVLNTNEFELGIVNSLKTVAIIIMGSLSVVYLKKTREENKYFISLLIQSLTLIALYFISKSYLGIMVMFFHCMGIAQEETSYSIMFMTTVKNDHFIPVHAVVNTVGAFMSIVSMMVITLVATLNGIKPLLLFGGILYLLTTIVVYITFTRSIKKTNEYPQSE